MGRDHLFERYPLVGVADAQEAGRPRWHLDAGGEVVVDRRVAQHHREVEREVGDIGERMPRVDGERGEHRKDPRPEDVPEFVALADREVGPAHHADTGFGHGGGHVVAPQFIQLVQQLFDHCVDLANLRLGAATVRRAAFDAGCHLVSQAGHPDLEELVEVATEDRAELDPLEQWSRRIGGEREDTSVER